MTRSVTRTGFSLMELMIAIVILGIGLVMVATVFPVGLELSREALQMNIAESAADAAVATLEIKVPGKKDLKDPNPPAMVLVPDVRGTDFDTVIDEPDDMAMKAPSFHIYPPPDGISPWGPTWDDLELDPSPVSLEDFFARVRVFTDRTGWEAESQSSAEDSWNQCFVVPSQNLPVAWGGLAQIPTMIHPTIVDIFDPGDRRSGLSRVHLVDQVYPPVPVKNELGEWRSFGEVLGDIANRRYSWLAFHHRMSREIDVRDMLVTIAVTHRADLNAHYAGQADLEYGNKTTGWSFPINRIDPKDLEDEIRTGLLVPMPKPGSPEEALDTLFPQPWLVMLNRVSPNAGLVTCTHNVARLLPRDSSFIVARTTGRLMVGSKIDVLDSEFDPALLVGGPGAYKEGTSPLTKLRIARGGGDDVPDVPVWVIPPAFERGTGQFRSNSPVAGVAIRRVRVSDR